MLKVVPLSGVMVSFWTPGQKTKHGHLIVRKAVKAPYVQPWMIIGNGTIRSPLRCSWQSECKKCSHVVRFVLLSNVNKVSMTNLASLLQWLTRPVMRKQGPVQTLYTATTVLLESPSGVSHISRFTVLCPFLYSSVHVPQVDKTHAAHHLTHDTSDDAFGWWGFLLNKQQETAPSSHVQQPKLHTETTGHCLRFCPDPYPVLQPDSLKYAY